jgi:branched-chain amino acid transport system substrate-binding protein
MKKRKLSALGIGLILVLVLTSVAFLAACSSPTAGPTTSSVPTSSAPSTTTSQPATSTQPTSAPATTSAAPPKTLLIGNLMEMTGWFAVHDLEDSVEAQIMADYINEKGGITVQGQKYNIKLVVEDGKSTFDGVTAAANKLVFNDNVKYIIGPNAFFSQASNPTTNANKVVSVLGFLTNQPGELDKSTPYTFTGFNGTLGTALPMVKYLHQAYPDVKSVVYVAPDDGATPHIIPTVKQALAQVGISIVGDPVLYPNEITDLNPVASKLNAANADAVLQINGIVPHTAGMLKGLREAGNNKPFASEITDSLYRVLATAGKAATTNVFVNNPTYGSPENPPLLEEIAKRIVAKQGKDAAICMQGANSLWVLKNALEAANSLDPVAVTAKWETLDTIDTVYGRGFMGGDLTLGINHHALTHPQPIQVINDGVISSGGTIDAIRMP